MSSAPGWNSASLRLVSARFAAHRAAGEVAPDAKTIAALYRRTLRSAFRDPVELGDLAVDGEIEQILESVADPRDAADRLVRAAVEAGGRDNATAVVVDVVGLVTDDHYDSEQQRLSLETKLGARP